MKRLSIIILIFSLLAVGVSFAAVNWYPTTNLLGGTVGSDTIGAAEGEDATFTVNLSTNSNTTWPSFTNDKPGILSVYDASCGSPFSCSNREFLSVKTVTGSSNPYTLTIKSRNADADGPTCTSCEFAEGAKFDLILSNAGIEQMQVAIDAAGLIAGQTWTGTHDFGGAAVELPNSTSLPGTCTVGQIYIDTDATTQQRLYACESTNTWVVQKGDIGLTGATGSAGVSHIDLVAPMRADNVGAVVQVDPTSAYYGQVKFSNSADKAANYVQYRVLVPEDLNASVALTAVFKFVLSGTDTGTHRYIISMADIADSASYGSPTFINPINLDFAGDASGAAGDVETVTATLTDWASALTADHVWAILLERDGDAAQDGSTVDSYSGTLRIYYEAQ